MSAGRGSFDAGERCAADIFRLELKLVAEGIGDRLQDQHSLLGDFRANAVAGKNG